MSSLFKEVVYLYLVEGILNFLITILIVRAIFNIFMRLKSKRNMQKRMRVYTDKVDNPRKKDFIEAIKPQNTFEAEAPLDPFFSLKPQRHPQSLETGPPSQQASSRLPARPAGLLEGGSAIAFDKVSVPCEPRRIQ